MFLLVEYVKTKHCMDEIPNQDFSLMLYYQKKISYKELYLLQCVAHFLFLALSILVEFYRSLGRICCGA